MFSNARAGYGAMDGKRKQECRSLRVQMVVTMRLMRLSLLYTTSFSGAIGEGYRCHVGGFGASQTQNI